MFRRSSAFFLATLLLAPLTANANINSLQGHAWLDHYRNDIKPWFTHPTALGEPVGNFPTFRDLTGTPNNQLRYTRMLSRQIYSYAMGYQLTGDAQLLRLAYAGKAWLQQHAQHEQGGYYPQLDESGEVVPAQMQTAQDQAYSLVGLSALYAVSRDPEAKAEMDEMRELILRGPYWDSDNGTVRDALDPSYTQPLEFAQPGNDLVSVVDQLNGYLLLYFNQNPNPNERKALLREIRTITDRLVSGFWQDGIFWDTDINRSDFNAPHVDIGHTIKTYWLLSEVDRYWAETFGGNPYRQLVRGYGSQVLAAAFNKETNAWNMRFAGRFDATTNPNPDWWPFCEANQFASRLALEDGKWVSVLKKTGDFWLNGNFIDRGRAIRGIREGIKGDGSLWGDVDGWNSKQNQWKNGYHETEHAVIMYLMSQARSKQPAVLYFAVPSSQLASFKPQPYLFRGEAYKVEPLAYLDDLGLVQVRVTFRNIR